MAVDLTRKRGLEIEGEAGTIKERRQNPEMVNCMVGK